METNDADLRNQAGEAIAVLYEIAREINSVFADPPESLLISLDKKANESAKYKGKKEKRLQRATFREIYNSFEVRRTLDRWIRWREWLICRKELHRNSISNSDAKRWK